MTTRKHPIIFSALLGAGLLLTAACKTTTSSTTTSTTPSGMSSSTTVATTPDTSSGGSGYSTSTTSATSSSTMPQTTTTTNNLNGTTTTTTTSTTTDANGNVIANTQPVTMVAPVVTGQQTTSTSVMTQPVPAGGTRITTTTTTTYYGQPPGMTTAAPATATATVTTSNPPMVSSGQTDVGTTSYFGFGPRHNHGRSLDLNLFADWANFSNTRGTGIPGTVATGPLGTSFKSANGYGISLAAFVAPALAVEFGASRINPDATFTATNAGFVPVTGTRVRMTPITATLQWHFLANHSFDPYIGLGGAYVMFQNRTNVVGGTTGLQSVNFSDRGGLLADAGVGFGLGRGFGLIFDAKYLRLRGSGTTNFGNNTVPLKSTFDLNPVILSAGIRFGF